MKLSKLFPAVTFLGIISSISMTANAAELGKCTMNVSYANAFDFYTSGGGSQDFDHELGTTGMFNLSNDKHVTARIEITTYNGKQQYIFEITDGTSTARTSGYTPELNVYLDAKYVSGRVMASFSCQKSEFNSK